MSKVEGLELIKLCEEQIKKHTGAISQIINKHASKYTFENWHYLIRAIEEYINIVLLSDDEENLYSLNGRSFFIGSIEFTGLNEHLTSKYNSSIAERFLNILQFINSFKQAYESETGVNLCGETLKEYADYFQSRRRYYVAFLYVLGQNSKKNTESSKVFFFNDFSAVIELNCISITTLRNYLMLNEVSPSFYIDLTETGGMAEAVYQPLDDMFLEPERLSATENQSEMSIDLLPVDKKKIFSKNEFINSVNLLSEKFSEFELGETEFKDNFVLIKRVLHSLTDDYHIKIPKSKFNNILKPLKNKHRLGLINESKNFDEALNSYEPFIKVGGYVYSNINLLQRYLYNLKNTILYNNKRFQIRTGFIFEDTVKPILKEHGFDVKDITRIEGKEFDVIATRNDRIYNFQCKNNFIDISLARRCPKQLSKSIKKLVNSYEKALIKEIDREHLITKRLGLSYITHYVISKYPVVCDNPNIINFIDLESAIKLIK